MLIHSPSSKKGRSHVVWSMWEVRFGKPLRPHKGRLGQPSSVCELSLIRDNGLYFERYDIPVFPELIVLSSAVTRSLKTVSTLSSPASTSIMSELGFVYFLENTLVRNTVRFWLVSRGGYNSRWQYIHQEHSRLMVKFLIWRIWWHERRIVHNDAAESQYSNSLLISDSTHTEACSRSIASRSSSNCPKRALSGFSRKNSLQ
jgi:hypothetical protein